MNDNLQSNEQINETDQKRNLHSVLAFNGSDAYLDINASVSRLERDFTIEAWVDPSSNSGVRVIYAEGDGIFYLENNELKFQKLTTGETISSTKDRITANIWNHVAVAKWGNKAGETKLYINGKQNDNQAPIPHLIGAEEARIGAQPGVADRYFQGKISEVRIWGCGRSQDEIEKNLSHRLIGNEPELMGYWPLSENSGTTAHDKTQNAKHATIYNATWSQSVIPIADEPDLKERLY